jgi:hypothetical protein
MQVFTARVQGGTIVFDKGIELTEGSQVTVIAGEADAPFTLSAADEAEVAESIAEADHGDVISAEELLRRLSR